MEFNVDLFCDECDTELNGVMYCLNCRDKTEPIGPSMAKQFEDLNNTVDELVEEVKKKNSRIAKLEDIVNCRHLFLDLETFSACKCLGCGALVEANIKGVK